MSELEATSDDSSSIANKSKVLSDDELMKHLGIDDGRYLLIDIGANLINKKFSRDLDAVIQRANDSGIFTCLRSSFLNCSLC